MFPSPEKTKYMLYGRGHSTLDLGLTFDGSHISKEPFTKILGVNFGYSSQVAAEWVKSISRQWRHGLHLVRRISHRLGGAGERIAKILVTSVLASKVAYAARFYSLKRVHFDKIATLYNEARRTILGLPRHTRTSELRKCLHLVDLRETLEQQLDIHMARLEHTLQGRAVARFIGVAVTNINDLPPTKPPCDLIDLTQHARPVPRNMDAKRHTKRREHYARQHQAEVTALSQDPAQVIVYTDAALHTSGWSATAAVFPSHDPAQCDPIVVANTNMTPSSPEQAEARAVLLALQTYEVRNPGPGTLTVFTDSQSTIRALKTHLLTSSPTIAALYDTALRLYRHRRVRVSIRWVPGHAGIDGNEKAHKAALEELHRDFPSSQRTLPVPPASPNDDQFPEDEAYVYDPVDAVRLVRRDWKHRLDASWTPEQFPIPENTFRRHQMVLLRRIRTGGAVTPHHVYRFELTRQRKLDPYYVPPDPRCQRCKDPDALPKLHHLIWECAALVAQRQEAWATLLPEDLPTTMKEWAHPAGDSERRTRVLASLLDFVWRSGLGPSL
ncbi:hypothetical protein ISCGN_013649 [Ixodes scapularis]